MKKYLLFVPFLLLGACKLFPISFDLPQEMNFDINQSGSTYNGTKVIDPSTNEQFKKNTDKIKDITVERVTYTISNFDGTNTQTANASFDVADGSGNGKVNVGSFNNLNIASMVSKETDLTASPASITALSGFMKASPFKVTVYYSGSVNQAPAKFSLKLKFYTKVKATL